MSEAESTDAPPQIGQSERSAAADAVTRRRFLYLGVVGGAALVGSNAATSLVTHRLARQAAEGEMAGVLASHEDELETLRSELQARITRLEQQLALYRAMDRLGLDSLINLFLDIYDRFWVAMGSGLQFFRRAVASIGETIARLEEALANLRGAAEVVGRLMGDLDARLEGVRQILNEVLKRTDPLREAVGGFMTWLINRIPFGVGARVVAAADRLTDLAASLPAFLGETRERLLAPLQSAEPGADPSKPLQGGLVESIRTGLLVPLQTHLDDLERMAGRWDAEFAKPLRAALSEREQIRQQLAKLESPGAAASEPGAKSLL